jgi:2-pyrone-4,6-dicarboxylate lactonase
MNPVPGIVDCHFHVIGFPDHFPMLQGRSYTPAPAALQAWRNALEPCGVTHGVVVQPSFYGTDNRAMLAALAEGGGRLAGVAAVDAKISERELDRLAQAGVRGVRMAHFDEGDPRARGGFVPLREFDALEPRLAERGMHLQLFTDSRLLVPLIGRLSRSRVPVVIDHMGRAPADLGAQHEGIQAMVRLLNEGPVWVKLSGIANLSNKSPNYADAGAVHEALLAAAPSRLVWGSDWPHTKPAGERPQTERLLSLFQDWTPQPLQTQILWSSAARLYGLRPDEPPVRSLQPGEPP